MSRLTGYGDEATEHDYADRADDDGDDRDLPGNRDGKRQIDQKLNRPGENAATAHKGNCYAHRLDADRAREVAGALIHEMRPTRFQERTNERKPQVHRDMGGGVSYLRHGDQQQQRFQGDRQDDEDEEAPEGKILTDQGEDLFCVEREGATGTIGVDYQCDQRQQRRDAYALCQRSCSERQQHAGAAHRIGREKVPEQSDGLPDLF